MERFVPENYSSGFLDKIRYEDHITGVKAYYRNLAGTNKKEAVRLINDKDLHFCTLYILQPEIARTGIWRYLNYRNLQSLCIAQAIYKKNSRFIDLVISNKKAETYELLKWILITGSEEDGLDNRFDEIIELCGALLVRYYKDDSILPLVADLIFERNRKRSLIHNLVWVFFEAHDPISLQHIAKYLRSSEKDDFELACKLLSFIPGVQYYRSMQGEDIYQAVIQWLQENSPFLRPTGECLHLTANPIPFVVSH